MNPNVWNIKEILSIPTGSSGTKTNWNQPASVINSVTDSPFVFGSQFWPDNSQGKPSSQELSLSSRTSHSQQSSQEGNDPKVLSNYHTKAFLFGEVNGSVHNANSILDKFEEDKKKAKEKSESDILGKECLHLRETLNNIQQSITGNERDTALCKTILDEFNNFAQALQTNLSSIQNGLSQQLETAVNEMNSQKQMLTEMIHKTGVATRELGSHVHSLNKNVEDLRKEQVREHDMLKKALKLLNTLVSRHSTSLTPCRVSDIAIQTSPGVEQPFNIQQNPQLDSRQDEVPSQDSQTSSIMKRYTRRSTRKRALMPPQRKKGTIWGKTSQPLNNPIKQVSSPLKDVTNIKLESPLQLTVETRSWKGGGNFVSPLSFWSQDSNSTECISNTEPCLEKVSADSKTEIPGKDKGLWQLFDISYDSDPFLVEEE